MEIQFQSVNYCLVCLHAHMKPGYWEKGAYLNPFYIQQAWELENLCGATDHETQSSDRVTFTILIGSGQNKKESKYNIWIDLLLWGGFVHQC